MAEGSSEFMGGRILKLKKGQQLQGQTVTYDRSVKRTARPKAWSRWLRAARALAAGACVCAALATAGTLQGQTGTGGSEGGAPPTTGPYALSGIVVDSLTGAPIRRALVQVNGRLTMTGDDGKFHIENLPQTTASVTAIKPGYQNPESRGDQFSRAMVAIGPDTPVVTLKLEPESAITVEVTNEDGEPVEALPVSLLSSQIQEGRRQWQIRSSGNTDDNGRFRAGELQAGKYYVSVGPSFRPIGQSGAGANASDLGYAKEFYPNAASLEGAAPVEMTPGKTLHLEFSAHTTALYRVSGTVVGGAPGQGYFVRLTDDPEVSPGIGIRVNQATGEFQSGEVPAGYYMLKASVSSGNRSNVLVGSLPLHVDSNLTNVTLALAPTVTIPVVFQADEPVGGSEGGQGFNIAGTVVLTDRSEPLRGQAGWSQPEGTEGAQRLVVRDVEPGTYSAEIRPNGNTYVASARYGLTDLLAEDLVVSEGSAGETIEVTLRSDGATLSGEVRSGDSPAGAGWVLLVPDGKPRQVRTEPLANGSYSTSNLPPGEYQVIAFESVDELEYTNPDVLRNYLSKAREVTLAPKQEARLDLELTQLEK
jgi:Carboxypeptidase regulatory-like domain